MIAWESDLNTSLPKHTVHETGVLDNKPLKFHRAVPRTYCGEVAITGAMIKASRRPCGDIIVDWCRTAADMFKEIQVWKYEKQAKGFPE